MLPAYQQRRNKGCCNHQLLPLPQGWTSGNSGLERTGYWSEIAKWKLKVLVAPFCVTLRDPMDCSPQGSSIHGISQARILERVAISSSKRSSWPRGWTCVSAIAGRFFTIWATREAQKRLPWPVIRPGLWRWECRILTSRPRESHYPILKKKKRQFYYIFWCSIISK